MPVCNGAKNTFCLYNMIFINEHNEVICIRDRNQDINTQDHFDRNANCSTCVRARTVASLYYAYARWWATQSPTVPTPKLLDPLFARTTSWDTLCPDQHSRHVNKTFFFFYLLARWTLQFIGLFDTLTFFLSFKQGVPSTAVLTTHANWLTRGWATLIA